MGIEPLHALLQARLAAGMDQKVDENERKVPWFGSQYKLPVRAHDWSGGNHDSESFGPEFGPDSRSVPMVGGPFSWTVVSPSVIAHLLNIHTPLYHKHRVMSKPFDQTRVFGPRSLYSQTAG